MKVYELLDSSTIQQLNKLTRIQPAVSKPVKQKEQLSARELHELMGTRRQTYHRVGGRVRGK